MTPARAVEIATLFEDTVIHVRHLTERRRPPPRAWPWLAAGAAALTCAFGAFMYEVRQIAALERAHEIARSAGFASGPFIVPSGGRWLDALVACAILVGTFALVRGLGRLRPRRLDFTIGPSPRADVQAPLDEDHALVIAHEGGFTLQPSPALRAEANGAPLAAPLELADTTRAFVDAGALRFIIQSTDAPARLPRALAIDWSQEAYIGAVGLAAGLFLALLYLIPPDPRSLALDEVKSDLVAHYVIKAPEPPVLPATTKSPTAGGGGGAAHRGPAGASGDHRLFRDQRGRMQIKGNVTDVNVGRAMAQKAAQNSAVLDVLAKFDQSEIGSVFGRDHAIGADAENVLGSLVGTSNGPGWGEDGMDLLGGGHGGGGTSDRTIGVNLNGIGPGTGPGRRGYGPPGVVGLHKHTVGNIDPYPPPHIITGVGLDKELVRRVVHAHHNEIKFCYERRLLARNGALDGRVVTRFAIGGNGRVVMSNIEASTVNDPEVEGCIAQAVRRWEFPRPTNGSLVVVSYPFVLHAQ